MELSYKHVFQQRHWNYELWTSSSVEIVAFVLWSCLMASMHYCPH